MPDEPTTLEQAEEQLRRYAAMTWWFEEMYQQRPIWSVAQIVEAINASPLPPISDKKVRGWIESKKLRAIDYGPPRGMVIYREDLARFLARFLLPNTQEEAG